MFAWSKRGRYRGIKRKSKRKIGEESERDGERERYSHNLKRETPTDHPIGEGFG